MLWYLFALLAPLAVQGYTANKPYPSLGACDDKTISSIKAFWKTNGQPKNVLQTVELDGPFTVANTTYDYHNSNNKCVYMKTKDGVLTGTFVPAKGDTAANTTYYVQENEDGIIRGKHAAQDEPGFRWQWYPIYYNNGYLVSYYCNDIEGSGSKEPPVVSILIGHNKKDLSATPELVNVNQLLKEWGTKFKYNYGPECFKQ